MANKAGHNRMLAIPVNKLDLKPEVSTAKAKTQAKANKLLLSTTGDSTMKSNCIESKRMEVAITT